MSYQQLQRMNPQLLSHSNSSRSIPNTKYDGLNNVSNSTSNSRGSKDNILAIFNRNNNNNNDGRKKCNISRSVSNSIKERNDPIDKCQSGLLQELHKLKKMDILKQSLIPGTHEFEILEFYGDCLMSEKISFNLLKTRRFMSPHLLTTLRSSIVNNINLASVFDTLGLVSLLDGKNRDYVAPDSQYKRKADIVEAILGEMSEMIESSHPMATRISSTRCGLLSFISYNGESEYFSKRAHSSQSQMSEQYIEQNTLQNDEMISGFSQLRIPNTYIQQNTYVTQPNSIYSDSQNMMFFNQHQFGNPQGQIYPPYSFSNQPSTSNPIRVPTSPIIQSPESHSPPDYTPNSMYRDFNKTWENSDKIFITEIPSIPDSGCYFLGNNERKSEMHIAHNIQSHCSIDGYGDMRFSAIPTINVSSTQ